jgi:hypothetical protein
MPAGAKLVMHVLLSGDINARSFKRKSVKVMAFRWRHFSAE